VEKRTTLQGGFLSNRFLVLLQRFRRANQTGPSAETVTVRDLWVNTEAFWNVIRGGDAAVAAPRQSGQPTIRRSSTMLNNTRRGSSLLVAQQQAAATPTAPTQPARSSLLPEEDSKELKAEAARQEVLLAMDIILDTYDLFKDSQGRVSTERMSEVSRRLGEFAPLFQAIFGPEHMQQPTLR
jgi:hypothetical protein